MNNNSNTARNIIIEFEMNKFEKAQTLVNARHITIVTERLLVTARAEHMPRICNAIGFSSISGL